jgi:hypothetical protein
MYLSAFIQYQPLAGAGCAALGLVNFAQAQSNIEAFESREVKGKVGGGALGDLRVNHGLIPA